MSATTTNETYVLRVAGSAPLLDAALQGWSLPVFDCADPQDVIAQVREATPRIVVLGDTREDMAICDQLKSDPDTAEIPVLISAGGPSPEVNCHGFTATRADAYVSQSTDSEYMGYQLERLLGPAPADAIRVEAVTAVVLEEADAPDFEALMDRPMVHLTTPPPSLYEALEEDEEDEPSELDDGSSATVSIAVSSVAMGTIVSSEEEHPLEAEEDEDSISDSVVELLDEHGLEELSDDQLPELLGADVDWDTDDLQLDDFDDVDTRIDHEPIPENTEAEEGFEDELQALTAFLESGDSELEQPDDVSESLVELAPADDVSEALVELAPADDVSEALVELVPDGEDEVAEESVFNDEFFDDASEEVLADALTLLDDESYEEYDGDGDGLGLAGALAAAAAVTAAVVMSDVEDEPAPAPADDRLGDLEEQLAAANGEREALLAENASLNAALNEVDRARSVAVAEVETTQGMLLVHEARTEEMQFALDGALDSAAAREEVSGLTAELERMKAQIEEVCAANEQLQGELNARGDEGDAALATLEEALEQTRLEAERAREEAALAREEADLAREERDRARSQVRDSEPQLAAGRVESHAFSEAVSKMQEAAAAASGAAAAAGKRADAARGRANRLQTENEEMMGRLTELEIALEQRDRELVDARDDLNAARTQISDLQFSMEAVQDSLRESQGACEEMATHMQGVESELSRVRGVETDLRADLQGADADRRALNEQLAEVTERAEGLDRELDAIRTQSGAELAALTASLAEERAQAEGLDSDLNSARARAVELTDELHAARDEVAALNEALEARDAALTERDATLAERDQKLAELEVSQEEARNAIEALAERNRQLRQYLDDANAQAELAAETAERAEALEAALAEERDARESDRSEAVAAAGVAAVAAAAAAAALAAAVAEADAAEERAAGAEAEIERLQEVDAGLRGELQAAEQRHSELENQLSINTASLEALKTELDARESELSDARVVMEQRDGQVDELELQLERERDRTSEIIAEVETIQLTGTEALTRATVAAADASHRAEAALAEAEQLRDERAAALRQLRATRMEASRQTDEARKAAKRAEEAERVLNDIRSDMQASEGSLTEARDAADELMSSTRSLERELAEARSALDERERQIGALTAALSEVEESFEDDATANTAHGGSSDIVIEYDEDLSERVGELKKLLNHHKAQLDGESKRWDDVQDNIGNAVQELLGITQTYPSLDESINPLLEELQGILDSGREALETNLSFLKQHEAGLQALGEDD